MRKSLNETLNLPSPFLLILLIVFACGELFAQQNVSFTSHNFKNNPTGLKFALDKIKEGDEHLKNEEYDLAMESYKSADSINPDNADLNVKIGVCYLNTKDFYKGGCLPYFNKGYALDHKISKRMDFYFARAYHLNYMWDSAITEYKAYLPKAGAKEKKEITRYIEQCTNGKALSQHPIPVKIENLGAEINSPYPDYSPFLTADENTIVFTSKRPSTTGGFIDPGTGEYFEDIYISHFKNGHWDTADNMGPPINTPDNDATAYLSPDGQKLFIFRDINGGDIYYSNLGSNGWSTPVALSDKINTPYHESTVCLSPDGKILYFVSDKPGGKGGRDIYKSYMQPDSSWGNAINLGDTINTPYDEEGVYIHPDGKTMYFSSKGHNSMGGYDIFKSTKAGNSWGVPENLGYPVNTPDDDVFFIVSASGKHGYYASAKNGGYGGLDIFRIEMNGLSSNLIVLKGVVLDSITRNTLSAKITLLNKTTNVTTPSMSKSGTGEYLLSLPAGSEYEIKVTADGYPDYTFNLSISDTVTYREIVKNIALFIPGSAPTKVVVAKTDTVKPVVADTCIPDIYTLMRRFNGLTADTNVLRNMVKHISGDLCLNNIMFTVQIGAYHFPKNFKYKNVEIKPIAITGFPDGITRFTMGMYKNYHEAVLLRNEARKRGVKDAWVTGIYKGHRVVLSDLLNPKTN
ncbi:MAG: hypothetical protein HKL88_07615 [Bacteroidia bacterium]|nr:hypothetical protein [Bacteroidia bacterium]